MAAFVHGFFMSFPSGPLPMRQSSYRRKDGVGVVHVVMPASVRRPMRIAGNGEIVRYHNRITLRLPDHGRVIVRKLDDAALVGQCVKGTERQVPPFIEVVPGEFGEVTREIRNRSARADAFDGVTETFEKTPGAASGIH